MSKRRWLMVGLGIAGAAALVRWQGAGRFVEEPVYRVEAQLGDGVEVRVYAPTTEASTVVEAATADAAANEGFRRLAGYIFGRNRARERVAMTAPVAQTARDGERVAMTAPVGQVADGAGRWTITFTMPRGRDEASLPVPTDARVVLRSVPERRVAVRRYAGRSTPERIGVHERALRAAIQRAGLAPQGDLVSARYDPPTTLPFLRRNEVWLALR